MSDRKTIIAANWKMNLDLETGLMLAIAINSNLQTEVNPDKIAILCPPFIHLNHLVELVKETEHIFIGAQNCHQEEAGAYTGEVSANMIASIGVKYVILGHSERRQYFKEDNTLLASKVNRALEHGLKPIYCCGEPLEVRKDGKHKQLVTRQIEEGLFHLPPQSWENIVIAYEPVWAIGTGEVATPDQAQEMHAHIRELLGKKHGNDLAQRVSILYGGSMKPGNAEELLSQPDVDGGLVGGASLKAYDFTAIYQSI